MASFEQARSLFENWTEPQLQAYIRDNGGDPLRFYGKHDLVNEAARLSVAAEQQRAGGSYPPAYGSYPGQPSYPPSAVSPYPPANGSSYPPPTGSAYPPAASAYPPAASAYPPPAASAYPPAGSAYPPSSMAGYPPASSAYPPANSAYPSGPSPFNAPSGPFGAPPASAGSSYPGGPPAGPNPFAPPSGYGTGYPLAADPYGSGKASAPSVAPNTSYGAPNTSYGSAAPAAAVGYAAGGYNGAHGSKKALLIGCNYPGTQAALRGCINDAQCMEYLLKTKFGYKQENIRMLRDDVRDPSRSPTRANIMSHIQWLVSGLKTGDCVFFHFSGHGSQQRDYTGEESDGMNETICPADYKSAGQITDNELNRALVNPIPAGVRLHAVIDACHSGTALDLPYRCRHQYGAVNWKQEYVPGRLRSWKGTAGGRAVQISAAQDSQVAADTNALSGSAHTGAATFAFIQAIERDGANISYDKLLTDMHRMLDKSGDMPTPSGGLMSALVSGFLGPGSGGQKGQTPILSSNEAFNLQEKIYI